MAKPKKTEEGEEKKKRKELTPFSLDSINPNFYLSSGCFAFDCQLGNADNDPDKPQGIASARMFELFGPNKSAKSELAQCFIRSAIKAKIDTVYYDQEWSADSKKLGVSLEDWAEHGVIYRADTLEEFYSQSYAELDKVMVKQKANKTFGTDKAVGILIVLDSMAAIKSESEVDKEMGATVMAGSARLNSEEMPKLRRMIGLTHSILIWVNQTRNKMQTQPGQSPETTPGGESPRFFADYRARLAFAGNLWVKSGKVAPKVIPGQKRGPNGFVTACKMIKNKLAPPMSEEEFAVFFKSAAEGELSGLSETWTMFYALTSRKKIKSSGGLYDLFGEKFSRAAWPEMHRVHKKRVQDLYVAAAWGDAPSEASTDDDDD